MTVIDDLRNFLQVTVTGDTGYLVLFTNPPAHEVFYEWPKDYEQIVQDVLTLQETSVYFSPHLFKEKRSTKENVLPTRTIVADLDNADVDNLILRPSMLVQTSEDRHQGYWILDDTLSLAELELLSKKLTYAIPDCDHSGWSLGHKFRLPGTRNFKYDPPHTTRLLETSSERTFPLEEIEDFVRGVDVSAPSHAIDESWVQNPPASLPKGPRETLEKYKGAIGSRAFSYYTTRQPIRHTALWGLMSALFRAGASRDEVYWIAKHSPNNKFADSRYSGERDLAKDVLRAETSTTVDKQDIKTTLIMAEKLQGTVNDRKRLVAKIVHGHMSGRGEFLTTEDERSWYLHSNAGRPILLGKHSERLDAMLQSTYGLNAADGLQPYVINELISETLSQGRRAKGAVLSSYTLVPEPTLLLHG